MRLIDAVRLTPKTRLAFVSLGEKHTALFRLAEQFSGTVLVTTATAFHVDQTMGMGSHLVIQKQEELERLREPLQEGVILVTGCEVEGGGFGGLSIEWLEDLNRIAYSHEVPLLIFSDGSTKTHLHGRFEHAPVIPAFIDTVIVSMGLTGLGEPLSEDYGYPSKNFEKLSGLKLGELVTPKSIIKVFIHPNGGLKNVPTNAHRIILLDQADKQEKAAIAKGMVKALLKDYHVVLIGDMIQPQDEVRATYVRAAGVILAAGESKRMKKPKQLLEWQGKPFIRVVAEKALKVGLDPVVVVTGAYHELVAQALNNIPVDLVHNPLWKAGQSTSVKTGIDALPEEIGAVIFFLVDQPKIPVNFIRTLIDTHAETLAPIIAPMVDHQQNNPVMFDRVTFKDFSSIEGDAGGRQIFSKHQITWVPWVDSSVFADVDTMEDYLKLN